MPPANRLAVFASIGSLLVLTAVVLGLAAWMLRPPLNDFILLGLFLLLSGGFTLLLGWLIPLGGLGRRLKSLRRKLLLLVGLISALGVVNVAFTSHLMFISPHDLGLLTILLVFSFGVSLWLAFFLTQPFNRTIQAFLDAANRIRRGQFDTRLAVSSGDEFQEMADTFNTMAAELDAAFARQHDLERARQELIAAVSHDLRNPLASIRAMVESINDRVVTDEPTIQRYHHAIQKEVEYLSRLIDDLFELSQINAGLISLQLDWANLQDVISDAVESVSAQAGQRSLAIEGVVDEDLAPVLMDTRRVYRVLLNLAQNALRHTPSHGTIRIQAKDLGPELCVRVSDTGEGIAPEELPRVFEQFYRGDRARSRDSSGGGLGLSIARGIVEAHGGRIWAESVPGEGASFSFTLPRQPRLLSTRAISSP